MTCRRLRLAGLLLGAMALHPVALEAQDGPIPEPVLIELQLGRISARTVEAYRWGAAALVPLGVFFEMAEIKSTRRDGVLSAVLQPGNVSLELDPASRILKVGDTRRTLQAGQVVLTPSDVYVDTRVIGIQFGFEWEVSWPDLQVTLINPDELPLARRIRRDALVRAQLASDATPQVMGERIPLDRRRIDGLIFDYSLLTPTTGLDGAAYSAMVGLDLLGGSLALGLESQDGLSRGPRSLASWTGVWRENPWLAQLQLGDAFSSGPRPRSVRGFSVTNSPFIRPEFISTVPYGGQLGAGWTVEAYRGGRLIGFDSVNALGRFAFDVPIQYGENPVDFVAYGPFGEVREFNQTYRFQPIGIPAGRLEYGASFGACRTTLCSANGNVDLRYGLTNRWTLRAGSDQFWRDRLGALSHPYAGIAGGFGNTVQVEAEVVANATMRGVVRFAPSIDLQLQAEGNRFARGVVDPILTPAGRLDQLTVSAFYRPVSRLGAWYLDASVDRINGISSDILSSRVGASMQVANIRVLPAVRVEREQVVGGPRLTRTFAGFNTFMLPQPSLGPMLGRLTARTSFELQMGEGPSSASAFVGIPVTRWIRAETGASWYRGRAATFQLLAAIELPTVRSYTTVTAGGNMPTAGTQYVTGSAIYNPARNGVDFSGTPALQRGGVTGRVFLDANGNGSMDEGEQPLPDVRVIVGPIFAMSDSSGNYHAWDIMPFEPTSVTIDSMTLASPLWVPAFARAMVEPSPNRYRQLDIPVLPGGTVEGRVTLPSGAPASGGIVLVLSHRESGERRLLTTFGDGAFYAIGIRPGEWDVTVDRQSLDALRMAAAPSSFTMLAKDDGAAVEGIEVRLR